jgi:hypothetical protein
VGDDASRRQWAAWVATQIGGDEWRQRTALEAAMQALQTGRTSGEAAAAARAAIGLAGPAPAAPAAPATQQAAPMAPAGVYRCRFCGSIPAAPMTVYEHNGFIVLMTFKNLKGPFCRSCGLHTWRRMTDTTLLRGWLGVGSFFIAPVTVLVNLINLRKLTSLPPPDTRYAVGRPAEPGPGMFRRFGVYVYAGVLVVLLLIEIATVAGR